MEEQPKKVAIVTGASRGIGCRPALVVDSSGLERAAARSDRRKLSFGRYLNSGSNVLARPRGGLKLFAEE
jgi:hypothetical protein